MNITKLVHSLCDDIKLVKNGPDGSNLGNTDIEHIHMEITVFDETGIISFYYEDSEDDFYLDSCSIELAAALEDNEIDIDDFCEQLIYTYDAVENREEYVALCK